MQDTHTLVSTDTTPVGGVPPDHPRPEAPRARRAPPAIEIDADEDDVARLLGADGPIARVLPGFRPRREQQHLAEAVARALERRTALVGEAGGCRRTPS